MRDIGKNIRDLREQRSLTQDQLAEQLFVTRQTVSNYETGRSRPDIDMLVRIAEVLATDVNTVLYGIPVPEARKNDRQRLIWALVLSGVLAAAIAAISVLHGCLGPRYNLYAMGFARIAVLPFAYVVWGWTALQLAGFLLHAKPRTKNWMKYIRWALLLILAVCLVWAAAFTGWSVYVSILGLLRDSVSETFGFLPPLTLLFTQLHAKGLTPLFLLPGAALWLLDFPKRKTS